MAERKPRTATRPTSPRRKPKKPRTKRKTPGRRKQRQRNRLPRKGKTRSPQRRSKSSEGTEGGRDANERRHSPQSSQGGPASRGTGHGVPARDESATQGNADSRGQAADSVCRGRVRCLRDRAHHHRDRKGKEFHRRSLRLRADAGTLPGRKREERASGIGAANQRHGAGKLHAAERAAGPGTRRAGGERFGGR